MEKLAAPVFWGQGEMSLLMDMGTELHVNAAPGDGWGHLRYAAHKCASQAQTGTHCDYLSFQTWKRQECVAK